MTTTLDEAPAEAARDRQPLRVVLLVVIAITALVLTTAVGFLWGSHGKSSTATPSATSVDAGFARDMSTHHQQAITMATYTEDNSDSTSIKAVAYDIESSQSVQLGTMTGWLQLWNVSRNTSAPMAWMGSSMHMQMSANSLMPGMATAAQMATLQTLHGKPLDIMFLQLMIRHHQGGIRMAQYAAAHAAEPAVRDLAANIYSTQGTEIVQMEQQLRQLGGVPLAPPAS